jgi:biopolymer transport protein ExbD
MFRVMLIGSILLTMLCMPYPQAHAEDKDKSDLSMMKRPETIRISTQGKIYIADEEVPLRKMAKQLKKEGIKPEQPVYVSIPDRTPKKALVAVSKELASNGYRRVIFTKPPKTSAKTEN